MKEIQLHEIRNIQINILKMVADYCNKEGLKYYLAYGTLLGAVRHKGYIPWDDDIDILMPRPDYEKFVTNFSNYNRNYKVFTHYNDINYPWPYAKVSYEKTLLIENSDIKFKRLGINIDIFPMDGLPNLEKKQKGIIHSMKLYRSILNFKSISLNSNRVFYKNAILLTGKLFLLPINYKQIINFMNDKAMMLPYNHSRYVGCLVWGYGAKEIMYSSYFDKRTELEFEGTKFFVPAEYHQFLTRIYGDYMQLPPKEQRLTHHSFKAFWKES